MIRIADIKKNDVANGKGVCVSLWFQGCPHKCKGCHNPETWSLEGGYEMEEGNLIYEVLDALGKNGMQRNLSILGGEPLLENNLRVIEELCRLVKKTYNCEIYLWTGYVLEELSDDKLNSIEYVDVLIDGAFVESLKDLNLELRGSSNQRILTNEDIKYEIDKRRM